MGSTACRSAWIGGVMGYLVWWGLVLGVVGVVVVPLYGCGSGWRW